MKYELYAPQTMGQPTQRGISIYPAPDTFSAPARVFVMCENPSQEATADLCAQTVGQYILRRFNPNKLFTAAVLQEALQHARTALEGSEGTAIAIVCFHRGGVLMASAGSLQIHHTRPNEGKILFSSLVNDDCVEQCIKPVLSRTTDVLPGDEFLITSSRMNPDLTDEQILAPTNIDQTPHDELTQVDGPCGLVVTVQSTQSEAADAMQPNDESFSRFNARLLPKKKVKNNGGKNRTGLVVGLLLTALLLAVGGWYGYEYYQAKKEKEQPKPKPVEVVPDSIPADTVPPVTEDSAATTPPPASSSSSSNYYNDPVEMPYSDPGPFVDPNELEKELNNPAETPQDTPPAPDEDDSFDQPEEPTKKGGVPPPPKNRRKQQPVPPPPSR